jgi:hypothetical protein
MSFNEFIVEDTALIWFGELGYVSAHGNLVTGNAESSGAQSTTKIPVNSFRDSLQPLRLLSW